MIFVLKVHGGLEYSIMTVKVSLPYQRTGPVRTLGHNSNIPIETELWFSQGVILPQTSERSFNMPMNQG